MAKLQGVKIVAQSLRELGVEVVFTHSGGHIKALLEACREESIRVVETRQPLTAGYAADAYARTAQRVGVVAVDAGPGVAGTLGALVNAQRNGVPLLCLAGASADEQRDMGAFQEFDAYSATRSLIKSCARVSDAGRLPEYVAHALRAARTGNPGVSLLELPIDLLMGTHSSPSHTEYFTSVESPAASARAVTAFTELLGDAKRPCFVLGSQVFWSPLQDSLREFADAQPGAYFLNGLARGSLPRNHPHLFQRARRRALLESDLVVVLGTPLDFRLDFGRDTSFNPQARVVHVSLDSQDLGRHRPVQLSLVADPLELLDRARQVPRTQQVNLDWLSSLREVEQPSAVPESDALDTSRILHALGRHMRKDDVLVVDGGPLAAGAAHNLPIEGAQLWLDSGPFASSGAGLSYAIGVSAVGVRRRCILLTTPRNFGEHFIEFEHFIRTGRPLLAIVADSQFSAPASARTSRASGEPPASADGSDNSRALDFAALVRALGGQALSIEQASDVDAVFEKACASPHATCVHISAGVR